MKDNQFFVEIPYINFYRKGYMYVLVTSIHFFTSYYYDMLATSLFYKAALRCSGWKNWQI